MLWPTVCRAARSIRLVLHYRAGGSGVLAWVAIAPPPPDFGKFISKPVPSDDLLTTVCPCPSPQNFKTFPRLWLYDMELCQGTIENKVCWTTNRQFLKGHQESEQCKIYSIKPWGLKKVDLKIRQEVVNIFIFPWMICCWEKSRNPYKSLG